jgi:hypothetical protein
MEGATPNLDISAMVPSKAELPPAPPELKACLKETLDERSKKVKASEKTADKKVISLMSYAEEKRQCGLSYDEWYEKTRKANGAS